ncbi:hypothetical protein A7D00_4736 [Trichophyton violaceum]|uniref:Uncharacterized protein n=1 Tax=Trichophyton violaceum TaxID=34388 RepID=A0A178FHP6_TRIVO|nr:hypothetical protein A7D00_4736 [Trichophyton violaceum]
MAYLLSNVTPLFRMVWPSNRRTPPRNGTTHMHPSATPGMTDFEEEPSSEEDYIYDINSQLASETQENKDTSTGRIPGVAKLLSNVTIGPPSSQTVNRAKPNFYITRPNGAKVPLIPLDELPEGLKLGDQDWYRNCWIRYMHPVSHGRLPSSGTYVATINSGTQLSRKGYTVRTPSGRVDILKKPKVIPPLLDCCVCENARSNEDDVAVQPQENRPNSTQSPLLPQRAEVQIGQRYGTFAPPDSLNMNLLDSSSSSSEEETAETDGASRPRGQDWLTRERSETPPGERKLSMGVLWEVESIDDDDDDDTPNDEPDMPDGRSDSQSRDDKLDSTDDTNDSQQSGRSNSLRFVNYTLARLDINEGLRMTRIHDPDEASN